MLGYATISNHNPSALVPSRGIFSGMGLIRYRSPPVFRVTTPRHTPLQVFRAATSGYTPLRVFRDSNPRHLVSRLVVLVVVVWLWKLRWWLRLRRRWSLWLLRWWRC